MRYLDQQRHLLAMPKTGAFESSRGERGNPAFFLRGSKALVKVTQSLLGSEAGPGPGQPGWLPLLGSLGLPGTESACCLTA